MNETKSFHVITIEGTLSEDTFVIPRQQPGGLQADCLVVVNERDRSHLTVHSTRLVPVVVGALPTLRPQKSACIKCGRVDGVVEDRVTCPYHGGAACGLVKAHHG